MEYLKDLDKTKIDKAIRKLSCLSNKPKLDILEVIYRSSELGCPMRVILASLSSKQSDISIRITEMVNVGLLRKAKLGVEVLCFIDTDILKELELINKFVK